MTLKICEECFKPIPKYEMYKSNRIFHKECCEVRAIRKRKEYYQKNKLKSVVPKI